MPIFRPTAKHYQRKYTTGNQTCKCHPVLMFTTALPGLFWRHIIVKPQWSHIISRGGYTSQIDDNCILYRLPSLNPADRSCVNFNAKQKTDLLKSIRSHQSVYNHLQSLTLSETKMHLLVHVVINIQCPNVYTCVLQNSMFQPTGILLEVSIMPASNIRALEWAFVIQTKSPLDKIPFAQIVSMIFVCM